MKKFSIIFLFALAVFSAGCSKDVETGKNPINQRPSWIDDETQLVPIQFGTSGMGVKTRSRFEDLEDMYGKTLGVVGVDVNRDWSSTGSDVFCLNDEIVTCGDVGGKTMIIFDEPRYYPYRSDYNYSFFSYYRGENPAALSYDSLSIKLPFTGKYWGCQDIVWARTDADTMFVKKSAGEYVPASREEAVGYYNGYNASYMRFLAKKGLYDTNLPTLSFQHATTNIRFVAVLDSTVVTSFDMVPMITQVRLSGDEVYTGAALNVVHKNAVLAGTFDVSNDTTTITLHKGDGKTALNITPDKDGEKLLDGFFLQPLSENSKLHLELDLKFSNGSTTTVMTDINKHVRFEAGYFYTYEVKLYRAVGIEIAVKELKEWQNGFATDVGDDVLGTDDDPINLPSNTPEVPDDTPEVS